MTFLLARGIFVRTTHDMLLVLLRPLISGSIFMERLPLPLLLFGWVLASVGLAPVVWEPRGGLLRTHGTSGDPQGVVTVDDRPRRSNPVPRPPSNRPTASPIVSSLSLCRLPLHRMRPSMRRLIGSIRPVGRVPFRCWPEGRQSSLSSQRPSPSCGSSRLRRAWHLRSPCSRTQRRFSRRPASLTTNNSRACASSSFRPRSPWALPVSWAKMQRRPSRVLRLTFGPLGRWLKGSSLFGSLPSIWTWAFYLSCPWP